jgi:hypothetical protein
MRTGLAIFGMIIGALLLLAGLFNLPIIPWPSSTPSVGSGGRSMPAYVRATAAIIGALFIVLAILTLTGTL